MTNQKGAINFDPKAVAGINDEVKNFGRYFGKGTISEITVNNPQANFLQEVISSLKPGATITVRGTLSNKYFSSIYKGKAAGSDGFILKEVKPTQTGGFFKTNGDPITGEIRQIILIKK